MKIQQGQEDKARYYEKVSNLIGKTKQKASGVKYKDIKLESYVFFLLFFLAAAIGYISGRLTVRINSLFVIILGKAWSSGHARGRYNLVGALAALVYFGSILTVFYPGEDFATKLASVPLFIGLYTVGIIDADRRFNDTPRIMDRIIQIMYHSPSNESSGAIDEASRIARGILKAMPESNVESLRLLFLFFDSSTAVFIISLSSGRLRTRRFIYLKRGDQIDYLDAWNRSQYLFYAIQGMKSMIHFSYYTGSSVWKSIGYNGEFLRRSYLN
ncbi:MAG TPA: hypothetical protein VKA09_01905 [Nitrososphaeraceae archaeon]|nr:hypothetical protein [Nitrososphaeraceae archaeon]